MFRLKWLTIWLVLFLGVALVAASTAGATKPEDVLFTFDLLITGPDSAAGTFEATGAIVDSGPASQLFWFTDDGNVAGIKTMQGQYGTIYVRFMATPLPTGEAYGHFVAYEGTGAYAGIHGQGDTWAAFVFDANWNPVGIIGRYDGRVHFEP
jgi:hypothetical protein